MIKDYGVWFATPALWAKQSMYAQCPCLALIPVSRLSTYLYVCVFFSHFILFEYASAYTAYSLLQGKFVKNFNFPFQGRNEIIFFTIWNVYWCHSQTMEDDSNYRVSQRDNNNNSIELWCHFSKLLFCSSIANKNYLYCFNQFKFCRVGWCIKLLNDEQGCYNWNK